MTNGTASEGWRRGSSPAEDGELAAREQAAAAAEARDADHDAVEAANAERLEAERRKKATEELRAWRKAAIARDHDFADARELAEEVGELLEELRAAADDVEDELAEKNEGADPATAAWHLEAAREALATADRMLVAADRAARGKKE